MSIVVSCSSCGTVDKVPDNAALAEHLSEIAMWERRGMAAIAIQLLLVPVGILTVMLENHVLLVAFFSLVFLVAFVAPLYITYRLARAIGVNAALWTLGATIPYLNILVVLVLNFHVVAMLKAGGLRVRPFGRRWDKVNGEF